MASGTEARPTGSGLSSSTSTSKLAVDANLSLQSWGSAIGAWYKSSRSSSSGIGMRMFGGEFIEESCSSSKLLWLCSLLPESVVWILARLQWMTLPLD